ncbi:DUF4235 domain-containing protein [Fulvivirga ulvae]|uniref:DUF4235 domain-containing protein n=1 Tax=Fulvivirga ulvae TaxID=2904245 RepID=UPI001F328B29|nr:DUF4235 domain-containing protein [Fulvivirga ulvae]UII32086.1 DUF4235 domain-containing protein [Fulvivirga ulvae]
MPTLKKCLRKKVARSARHAPPPNVAEIPQQGTPMACYSDTNAMEHHLYLLTEKRGNMSLFKNRNDILNFALAQGAVMISGLALKKVFDYGYKKIAKENPPRSIRSSRHTAIHIIGWSILTGAVAGVARLLTTDLIKHDLDPHYLEAPEEIP